ncbi:unnamed protein product [Musa hybrid cultivar]
MVVTTCSFKLKGPGFNEKPQLVINRTIAVGKKIMLQLRTRGCKWGFR